MALYGLSEENKRKINMIDTLKPQISKKYKFTSEFSKDKQKFSPQLNSEFKQGRGKYFIKVNSNRKKNFGLKE